MQIYSQLRGTVAQKMHRAIRPYFAAGTRVVTRQAQLLMFLVACLNVLFAGCGPQAKAPTLPQGESPTNRESEVAVVPSSRNTHHPAQTLPAISFRDRAQSAGVTHIYDHGGAAGHASILESVGGGCAIFDFDRDQQLDLFFPSGGRFLPDQQIAGLQQRRQIRERPVKGCVAPTIKQAARGAHRQRVLRDQHRRQRVIKIGEGINNRLGHWTGAPNEK